MQKQKLKMALVVGARPNFTKIAPVIRQLEKNNISYDLIHTGQHYDENMSEIFFKELGIPKPHINLSVGSGSHAKQTAEVMVLFEEYCLDRKPDVVLVVGDINSTLACAVVVSKMKGIKLGHIEAGLRSFDREMPEEINRIITDVVSDYLFCTVKVAADTLISDGVDPKKVHLVGDVLIDNLIYNLDYIDDKPPSDEYILLTLHRPVNTDVKNNLRSVLEGVAEISKKIKVIFPAHPRTKKQIIAFGLEGLLKNIDCCKPFGYLKFLKSMRGARIILTDSGGVQPESYFLGVPCITLRDTTEHVFTLAHNANVLVGADKYKLISAFNRLYNGVRFPTIINELYDGKAAKRIVKILMEGI